MFFKFNIKTFSKYIQWGIKIFLKNREIFKHFTVHLYIRQRQRL